MFRPTLSDVESALKADRQRHLHRERSHTASRARLQADFDEIAKIAVDIGGTTHDADLRGLLYYALFVDSERNFMFPLVAAHGSLWGVKYTQTLDRAITPLKPLSRHGRIDSWLTGLDQVRDVNRRVFREIYTTFHFTRYHGQNPLAGEFIKPPVLQQYNRVHDAIFADRPLTREQRESVYFEVFVHEQDDIVDPGLVDAASVAGPLLVRLSKRVSPRFAYFPRRERLWFTDFTDVNQRNREGLRALRFAEEVGPERVLEAMGEY